MRSLTDLYLEWEDVLSVEPVDVALIASLEAEAEAQGVKLNDVADVLVAGFGRWNPDLHPRGRDGRFIEIFGLIDLLNFDLGDGPRRDYRGKVMAIRPNRHAPGKPDSEVEVPGHGKIVAKPDQIRSAEKAAARLDVPDAPRPMPDVTPDAGDRLFEVATEAPIDVTRIAHIGDKLNITQDRANTIRIDELDFEVPGIRQDEFYKAFNAFDNTPGAYETEFDRPRMEGGWKRGRLSEALGRQRSFDVIGVVEGNDGKVLVVEEGLNPDEMLKLFVYDTNMDLDGPLQFKAENELGRATLTPWEYRGLLDRMGIEEHGTLPQYMDYVNDVAYGVDDEDREALRDILRRDAKLNDMAEQFQIRRGDLEQAIKSRARKEGWDTPEPEPMAYPPLSVDTSSYDALPDDTGNRAQAFARLNDAGFDGPNPSGDGQPGIYVFVRISASSIQTPVPGNRVAKDACLVGKLSLVISWARRASLTPGLPIFLISPNMMVRFFRCRIRLGFSTMGVGSARTEEWRQGMSPSEMRSFCLAIFQVWSRTLMSSTAVRVI
jgi:hypothetical protein